MQVKYRNWMTSYYLIHASKPMVHPSKPMVHASSPMVHMERTHQRLGDRLFVVDQMKHQLFSKEHFCSTLHTFVRLISPLNNKWSNNTQW
jgi:hypothetical protein